MLPKLRMIDLGFMQNAVAGKTAFINILPNHTFHTFIFEIEGGVGASFASYIEGIKLYWNSDLKIELDDWVHNTALRQASHGLTNDTGIVDLTGSTLNTRGERIASAWGTKNAGNVRAEIEIATGVTLSNIRVWAVVSENTVATDILTIRQTENVGVAAAGTNYIRNIFPERVAVYRVVLRGAAGGPAGDLGDIEVKYGDQVVHTSSKAARLAHAIHKGFEDVDGSDHIDFTPSDSLQDALEIASGAAHTAFLKVKQNTGGIGMHAAVIGVERVG